MKNIQSIISCVAMVALLTGCKDRTKKAYHQEAVMHKDAAVSSARIAGKAAKVSMKEGYEAVCAEGKRVRAHVAGAGEKMGRRMKVSARRVGNGLRNATLATVDTLQEVGSKTAQGIKSFVNGKNNEEVVHVQKDCVPCTKKHTHVHVVDEKELHTMSDVENDDQD